MGHNRTVGIIVVLKPEVPCFLRKIIYIFWKLKIFAVCNFFKMTYNNYFIKKMT